MVLCSNAELYILFMYRGITVLLGTPKLYSLQKRFFFFSYIKMKRQENWTGTNRPKGEIGAYNPN